MLETTLANTLIDVFSLICFPVTQCIHEKKCYVAALYLTVGGFRGGVVERVGGVSGRRMIRGTSNSARALCMNV